MSVEIQAPKYPILDDLEVPGKVLANWQITLDLLAKIAGLPAALIMRVHPREIEVFVRSRSPGNVYHPGEKAPLDTGLYCETVMNTQQELLVPNALIDPRWDKNPDIALGMISYCGLPLTWPGGKIFGTICILDQQSNGYSRLIRDLLARFRDSVQFSLGNIYDAALEHQAREAAESANRDLDAFSYSVSHDLRAPLRAIDAFSHALQEDCGDRLDEAGKDHLQKIRNASQRMAVLIDDLLKLARLGNAPVNRQCVHLSKVVRGIVAELRAAESARQVEVAVAEDVQTQADPHLIAVVLENLLRNAWKFTSKTPQARIEFGVVAATPGTLPAYFVRDNGAGFEMQYVDKLFGAFQRLHRADEFPGTGIGLATVQRIIHHHGGRVWAEGEVGQGATFYFTLASPQP